MDSEKSVRFALRLILLIGVFAVLMAVLVRQQGAFDWRALVQQPPGRKPRVSPVAAELDRLDEASLKPVRAKKTEIDLLRQKYASAKYPRLGVPVVKGATTDQEVQRRFLKFRLRELTAYREQTNDAAEAKRPGEAFLEAYLRNYCDPDFPSDDQRVDELGQAALAAGSRDPMVRAYHAYVRWTVNSNHADAERAWLGVIGDLPKSRYPKIVEVFTRCFLRELATTGKLNRQHVNEYRKVPIATIVRWLEEEGTNSEWTDCLCYRMTYLWGLASIREKEELLLECLKSRGINDYVLHRFAGDYFILLAWEHRTERGIKDVTPEQYRMFRITIDRAAEHLHYAWFLHPELPYAPRSLITICKANEGTAEPPEFWFHRTLEAQFDFSEAYFSLTEALLPRWGGSHEQLLTFAENCIGTARFDTFVPFYAIEVLKTLRDREHVDLKTHQDALRLIRGFVSRRNAFRKASSDSPLYDDGTYRDELVRIMLDCDLTNLAAAEVGSVEGHANWTLLQRDRRPARYLAARADAARGPEGKRIVDFDEKLRRPWHATSDASQLVQLNDELQNLQEQVPAEDGRTYFAHAAVILEQLRQFSSGAWTELKLDPDLPGWEPYCNSWKTEEDSSVVLSGAKDVMQAINLRPLANFQPPLEIEATLELLDPPPYLNNTGFGWCREGKVTAESPGSDLNFALESAKYKTGDGPLIRYDSVRYSGVWQRLQRYPLKKSGSHRLRLKLWDQSAEFTVDDAAWLAPTLAQPWNREGFLCLGTNQNQLSSGGSVRWSEIRIRKLDEALSPLESDSLEVRSKYWEGRHAAATEGDPIAQAQLCRIRFEQGRYEEVVTMVDQMLQQRPGINDVEIWKVRAQWNIDHNDAAAFAALTQINETAGRQDPEVISTMSEMQTMTRNDALRDVKRGQRLAQSAVDVSGQQHARALAALAAAEAELGDFQKALATLNQALEIATDTEKLEWEPRRTAYEASVSYRYPATDPNDAK